MIHLQRYIRDVIEDKLKDSTDALTIRVSLYNAVLPSDFSEREEDDKSYETFLSKYINIVIGDFTGDWIEVPKTNILNSDVRLNIQVPTMEWHTEPGAFPIEEVYTQDTTEKVFLMLDNLRRKWASEVLPVGDVVWQLLDEGEVEFTHPSHTQLREIEFSARFVDDEDEDIIEAGNFVIRKNSGDLEVVHDGSVIHSFEFDKEEYYEINIKDNGSDADITVDGEETNVSEDITIDSEFTLHSFGGYIEYLAANEQTKDDDDAWDDILIEDFDSLENKAKEDDYTIDENERYAANQFGKEGVMTFGITNLTPVTQQYTFDDQSCLYQQFEVILGVTYGRDIFAGNHYRYFLDGEEVYPFSMTHSFAPEPESDQYINDYSTKTLNRSNTIGHSLTLYHKNDHKINRIVREALRNENNQNNRVELTVQYPNFKEDYDLVITELGTSPVINSTATVSFDLQPRHNLE